MNTTLAPVEHDESPIRRLNEPETIAAYERAAAAIAARPVVHSPAGASIDAYRQQREVAREHALAAGRLVVCDYCLAAVEPARFWATRVGETARHCRSCPRPTVQLQTGSVYDADDPFAELG